MLNYTEFVDELKNYFSKDDFKVKIINDLMEISRKSNKQKFLLNITKTYYQYLNSKEEFHQIINSIDKIYENKIDFLNYESIKDRLFIKVGPKNTTLPYTEVEGLAITYHILISKEYGCNSIQVREDMLDRYGVDIKIIHEIALKNTQKLFPLKIMKMGRFLKETTIGSLIYEELDEMIVLTNDIKINGASALFYPGIMEKIHSRIGNYYILPSSIHEVILVPDILPDLALKNIVLSVNRDIVDVYDFLSDNIFYYDKENDFRKVD